MGEGLKMGVNLERRRAFLEWLELRKGATNQRFLKISEHWLKEHLYFMDGLAGVW